MRLMNRTRSSGWDSPRVRGHLDPPLPDVDGAVAVAGGLVHAGEVVVDEGAVGAAPELGDQQRLVARSLVGPVTLVPEVLDGEEVERIDAQAVGGRRRRDRRHDRFVDRAAEPDVGSVAPQPVLPVGRPPDPGDETHPEGHAAVGRVEEGARAGDVAAHPFVGVDVEDPVTGGEVEAPVARGGEVTPPGLVPDHRAVTLGDAERAVGRAGVDDHDLVDEPPERGQAGVEMRRLRP